MRLIKSLLPVLCFLMQVSCVFAAVIRETKSSVFSIDSDYLVEGVGAKNIVDLDSKNSDDSTSYIGIMYSFGFSYENKERYEKAYLNLERYGPGDYDTPVWIHRKLINTGGSVAAYRNEQLLPEISEFWYDTLIWKGIGVKTGLFFYEVGNSYSLNGCFENPGILLYRSFEKALARFYYCKPLLKYKNRLGPRIPQEWDQGYHYYPNASNFFSTDVTFDLNAHKVQPYLGVLADYTSPDKRDNLFSQPVKRDILGTYGLAYTFEKDGFVFKTEAAHNFGEAQAAEVDFKRIEHTGYMLFAEADYTIKWFTPKAAFMLASGNSASLESALSQDTTLGSGKNRAFSTYSPLNRNLGYALSGSDCDLKPLLFMGNGNGLHSGVLRPGSLVSSDFEDIVMPWLGLQIDPHEKVSVSVTWFSLHSFSRPVGTLDGQARYLSKELGNEVDLTIDYKVNKHYTVSFLGGYFLPGKYYKEERDDTSGSLLSPFVRGDGGASPAYQVELSMELMF
ncbi:MAG TPA: hypothetical protein PKL77_02295 [Candidatus Omnitrophota bacterium]|nr:hypothetical protein [Candidatus Omnitrophota bacterium]HPT06989.1 hypothetical protein [Candidatus Omnitrophota bacterium]